MGAENITSFTFCGRGKDRWIMDILRKERFKKKREIDNEKYGLFELILSPCPFVLASETHLTVTPQQLN